MVRWNQCIFVMIFERMIAPNIINTPILMMLLRIRNRFAININNKITDKGLLPAHPPTTDCWPIGTGQIPHPLIKISGWNINGFRGMQGKGNLGEFMDKFQPDFMCLNETKIDYKSFQILRPAEQNPFPGYEGYWNFCKVKLGYSGVAIFAKHRPISVVQDFPNEPDCSLEGRVITLEYEQFFLISIYSPTSGMELDRLAFRTLEFDRAFKKHVKELSSSKPVIIFGDMNVAHNQIDLAKPKGKERTPGFTKEERLNFSSFLSENKLIDTYRHMFPHSRKYSWWNYRTHARRSNDGWRLDYILTDHRLPILRAAIHNEIMGSDHCPVSAIINVGEIK